MGEELIDIMVFISFNYFINFYLDHGTKSGPFRVWLKTQNYPGLAMSRSIGDLMAGSIGVTPEPGMIIFSIF